MIKKIEKLFWGIFLFPDNSLTFFSGIFVAISVNILTSQIPQSVFAIGWTFFLAAILLFIIAGILLSWSATIKSLQLEYNESSDIRVSIGALECWYNIINRNTCQAQSTRKKLIIFFLLIVVLFVLSIILLAFSDDIKFMVDCAINIMKKVESL